MKAMDDNQQLVVFDAMDLDAPIEVLYKDETVWLSQQQMESLFSTDRTSIAKHINNIYKTNELSLQTTCAKIAQVRFEGSRKVTRSLLHYNLDMIISLNVNSLSGTQFRIWATGILKEHLIKGYTINEKRLHRIS